jgi:hypothetical protein
MQADSGRGAGDCLKTAFGPNSDSGQPCPSRAPLPREADLVTNVPVTRGGRPCSQVRTYATLQVAM